jgi:hypothetical protein
MIVVRVLLASLVLAGAAAALPLACGSGGSGGLFGAGGGTAASSTSGAAPCSPIGEQIACACPGSGHGAQRCQADGTLTPCDGCGGGAAATSGSGGNTGAAGTTTGGGAGGQGGHGGGMGGAVDGGHGGAGGQGGAGGGGAGGQGGVGGEGGACEGQPGCETTCDGNHPCPEPQQCVAGVCRYPCATEGDCQQIDARFVACNQQVCMCECEVGP